MTASSWDAWRNKKKGEAGRVPKCSWCGATSVLEPCRACASPAQLAAYPELPAEYAR